MGQENQSGNKIEEPITAKKVIQAKDEQEQAKKYNRDIVPVHFEGRNSNFFYRLAKIRKALGIKFNIEMIFLPDEMFRQKNSIFEVTIGKPIPIGSIDSSKMGIQQRD